VQYYQYTWWKDHCTSNLTTEPYSVYPVSVVPVCSAHNKPWQMSGHHAITVNWPHIVTHITWWDIQTTDRKLSAVNNHIVKFWIATCMEVSAFEHIYEHFSLSIASILFEHNVLARILNIVSKMFQHLCITIFTNNVFPFCTIAQCMCFLNTASSMTLPCSLWNSLSLPFEPPVNQAIKTFWREQSSNQGQNLPINNLDPGCKHFFRWQVCNLLLFL